MAKITITERDLTSSGGVSALDNIVYVPGYSNWGPVGEPTLCTSVEQFKRIFGSTAYKFKKDSLPYRAGESEKGYLYALDILMAGMYVMFERLQPTGAFYEDNYGKASYDFKFSNYEDSTLKPTNEGIKVEAKYPGTIGVEYKIQIKNLATDNVNVDEDHLFTLDVFDPEDKNTDPDKRKKLESFKVSLYDKSPRYIERIESAFINVSILGSMSVDMVKENKYIIPSEYESFNLNFSTTTSENEIEYDDIIDYLKDKEGVYKTIQDSWNYNIKFITSGPYYAIDNSIDNLIAWNMLNAAAERGDAVALLDFSWGTSSIQVNTIREGWLYKLSDTNRLGQQIRDYGAAFAPNINIRLKSTGTVEEMPASFGYLLACASSFRFNPTWLPVAGVIRGIVPGLIQPEYTVPKDVCDTWQDMVEGVAVNPIMSIRNYGWAVYGNRTTHRNIDGLVANSFLNIRVGSDDIKKVLQDACKRLMFEVNDNALWINFRALVEPYLNRMVSGGGLRAYKLEKGFTARKGVVIGKVRVIPIEGVEAFELDFTLEDNFITVL